MKKQLAIFGIAILFIGIALSGCVNDSNESRKTMTYSKLMSDVRLISETGLFTLQSYEDGEVIYIEDTVYNVSYFEISKSEKYTVVTFSNSTSLEGFPIFISGDKINEYTVGSAVSIPVHVKNYVIFEIAVTLLEEWYPYISGMLTPFSTGKTMMAAYQRYSTDSGCDVVFKVTSTDPGIPYNEVSVVWENGSCPAGKINNTDYSTAKTGNMAIGDYFSFDIDNIGTYTVDFFYNGKIIYTSPTLQFT